MSELMANKEEPQLVSIEIIKDHIESIKKREEERPLVDYERIIINQLERELVILKSINVGDLILTGPMEDVEERYKDVTNVMMSKEEYEKMKEKCRKYDELKKVFSTPYKNEYGTFKM